MNIAVWRTGHEIADRVAESLVKGLNGISLDCRYYNMPSLPDGYDANIAYGILRDTGEVFKASEEDGKPWFNVDRGYFKPSHYDGYYRISCRGTQQTFDWPD